MHCISGQEEHSRGCTESPLTVDHPNEGTHKKCITTICAELDKTQLRLTGNVQRASELVDQLEVTTDKKKSGPSKVLDFTEQLPMTHQSDRIQSAEGQEAQVQPKQNILMFSSAA